MNIGKNFAKSSDRPMDRREILERAEKENAVIAICHHSGFGRVVTEAGKKYWQAL